MGKYTAIFFDLDGTLRANQPEGFQAFIEYASRVGVALTPAQIAACERAVHRYWSDGAQVVDHLSRYDERGFWINYNQLLLHAMDVHAADGIAERIQDQFDHYEPQDVVFADVPLVLSTLKQAGYVLGLVSNRDRELDTPAERYGFRHYFDFTLSGGQAQSFKPDAGIFRLALQMAGDLQAQQTLYVGDNYYADIVGALNVGMDAVLIDPRDIFRDDYDKRIKSLRDVLTIQELA
ncbi:MAG: HAD family hydrolase [Chloroflexi bacterium]|nr:HAD family hydrolase [Chloroflexota bacterium]